MTPVLVLRPEPGASVTVGRARDMGLDTVSVPLFEIEPVAWQAPEAGRFDGLLLTSANAVHFGGKQLRALRGLPAYAVGEATAEAARDAGFDIKSVGDSGADRLLQSIEPGLTLLHLCGEVRKAPVEVRQRITPVTVYRAKERDVTLDQAPGCVILVHSPRAGRRLAVLIDDRDQSSVVAISPAAAQAVGNGWKSVQSAEHPNDDAMLALAARLCKKPVGE